MTKPLRLPFIATFAMLSACSNLTSDNPIGGSAPNHADAHLIGVWKVTKNEEPGEAGYMFVSPKKDGSALHAVLVSWGASKPSETLEFDVVTGAAGGDNFADINHIIDNGKVAKVPPGYMPFVYQFDPKGALLIYDESTDGMKLIKAAVDAHKLKGIVTVKKSGDKKEPETVTTMDIHLTSDQKTVDAFFSANAKAIFTDPVDTFQPVKTP